MPEEVKRQTAGLGAAHFAIVSPTEPQDAQKNDPCIVEVQLAIIQKMPPSEVQTNHPDLTLLKQEWDKLFIEKDLLYRTVKQSDQHR